MPFIHIRMFPRSKEIKQKLAKELTEVISRHCGVKSEETWIVFDDVLKESWAMSGILKSDG